MNCQKKRILIIEDDPTFSLLLETWCQKNNYDSVAVFTIKAAQEEVYNNTFDLILSDLRLPDSDGIMFLTWLKDQKNEVPVIILTNYADIRTAVSAMKLGAFDFMEKPVNHLIMSEKVKMAMEEKKDKEKSGKHKVATIGFDESINYSDESNVNKRRKTKSRKQDIGTGEKDVAVDMVIGNSTVAEEMFAHIRLVAPTELSVLITGASGTGKEHVAKTIHTLSKRNKAPFVAVDCGALSKELSASEFFGHLKGSFTSAISDKTGVFEEANGGTLFFDEVGNLHYDVQVQLLRTLQERKIRKVGSSKEIAVDVRLICATNEDLTKAIQEGRFREDLYHRLQEFMINVPTLHNRIEILNCLVIFLENKLTTRFQRVWMPFRLKYWQF